MQKLIRSFLLQFLIIGIALFMLAQGNAIAQQGQKEEEKQEKQEKLEKLEKLEKPERQEKQERMKKHPVILQLEQQIAGREHDPAEEVFKNIKIMKGFEAIRLLRIMEHGFSPALGVKCTYCHVKDEWDKDKKAEKKTARKMWKLVGEFNSMLRENIDEKASINCYTCHRGDITPATRPKKRQRQASADKDK